MKTISKVLTIMGIAAGVLVGCAGGSLVVRERPVEPAYERPAGPAGAVWVSGEWEWRGGRYEYVRGHYVERETRQWVPGHWRETNGGYAWVRGHWR